ncbi:YadA-like family protein [Paraburkholderia sp. GAS348]|uniref:YadA-like family protein n=1 Tax=Paraburkholderia sp. GAS348 TaxID=3035132 RepID=UPI003D1BBFFB
MNKIYKSVWCEATGTWVATSETTRSKTKRGTSRKLAMAQVVLAGAALVGSVSAAYADPASANHYFSVSGLADGSDDALAVDGMNSIAAGPTATAAALDSIAIGNSARALNSETIALGTNTAATGASSVAVGFQSKAAAANSVAFGENAFVTKTATDSVAIGSAATATAVNSVALGAKSTTTADLTASGEKFGAADSDIAGLTAHGEVSVGSASNERRLTNVAAGAADTDAVNVSQLKAVDNKIATATANSVQYDTTPADKSSVTLAGPASTDGGVTGGTTITNVHQGTVSATSTDAVNGAQLYSIAGDTSSNYIQENGSGVKYVRTNDSTLTPGDAHATASGASAVGYNAQANGVNSVAIGYQGIASAAGAVAVGAGSWAQSENSVAMGADSQAIGSQAGAFGTNAYAFGAGSVALGANAAANSDNSVALGQDSVADRTNAVSVGSSAMQRQITNVADGTAGTDAVNVRQLQAAITAATAGEMRYFQANGANDGTDDAAATGLRAVAMGPAASASGTNAFAGGNAAYASGDNSVAIGNQAEANGDGSVAIGAKAVAGHDPLSTGGENIAGATAIGASAQALATNATALGNMAAVTADNAVALGQGSIADRANTVSVGSVNSERQITNVAAGTADTDAVNVAQLKEASAQTAAKLDGAVMYDTNADGSVNKNSVTLGGDAASGGTVIHNVGEGVDPTDAVNLGQLNAAISSAVQNITVNPNVPFFSADGNTDTEAAQASGTHSVAMGANANATGTNAIAMGANSIASGNNATALGAAANASADNSVALGQGSVADRANTVSVGAAGQERQITNVAAGVQGTDAVNVNQLQQSMSGAVGQANSYTDDKIRSARRDSYGGTASALAAAGLPQAVLPGHGMVAIAGGKYGGQSAMAIGVSQLSETGKWVYKVQGTTDSRGQFGASVGAGMHW